MRDPRGTHACIIEFVTVFPGHLYFEDINGKHNQNDEQSSGSATHLFPPEQTDADDTSMTHKAANTKIPAASILIQVA